VRIALALGCTLLALACSKTGGNARENSVRANNNDVAGASRVAPLSRQESPHSGASRAAREATALDSNLPSYVVEKLASHETIKIDGKLDEPAWKQAKTIGPFVHPGTGERLPTSAPLGGMAWMRYDDSSLYVAVEAKDLELRGGFDPQEPDPHLWTRDTVELMLDPEGDGDNLDYYEIQVSPQGLIFDSAFDSYNAPRVLPNGPFGHQEWRSQLRRAITLKGTLDDASDRDEGYVVEMALPFASLYKLKQNPPKPGTVWRGNLYVMQDNSGVSWSPILGQGNFHRASRFGRLIFGPVPPNANGVAGPLRNPAP
jgi:hypothetical protein